MSSRSEAFFLMSFQMSMVKMVEAELKMEVREDIRAASITASIRPFTPGLKKKMVFAERMQKQQQQQ